MKLPETIKKLLQENEKVILPGFGTLEMKEGGSEVAASGKMLTPPGFFIKFDPTFSKDDGKLSSFFSEQTGIDKEEASQQILEFIDEIRFSLDRGESFNAFGFGVFYRDEEQRTRFQIDPQWIIDPDQYGLDSVELFELDEKGSEEIIEKSESGPPEKKEELVDVGSNEFEEKSEKVEMVVPEQGPFPEMAKRSSKFWRIIWIVSGLLIVVLVVILLIPVNEEDGIGFQIGKEGFLLRKKVPKEIRESTLEVPDKETIIPGEQEESELVEENLHGEESEALKENLFQDEPQPLGHQYFIIAGSFKNLQNASDLQDDLKSLGYTSEIIITENRMYRVSLESYATKGEALKALEKLKKDSRFDNYWVLTN